MRNALIAIVVTALGIPLTAKATGDANHAADETAINAVITDRFLAGWMRTTHTFSLRHSLQMPTSPMFAA